MHDKARFYKFCQRVSIESGKHTHSHCHTPTHTLSNTCLNTQACTPLPEQPCIFVGTHRDPLCWNGNGYEVRPGGCCRGGGEEAVAGGCSAALLLQQRLIKIDEATYGRF